ncbi:hypothetical protein SAMN05421738_10172 [Algoriella xinjiangensis]|uniref:Uncharacterized protein n=1 Tax=Algoriella xinjiangensis TaxID=684065 RepID=A0A1I4S687_9FLAO|nr:MULTISPECIES: STM3941 family protein [Algoriella]MBO6211570.1 hypothetical protein [Algoriella sp.]SFM60015.1 hypothetical protein SAMN05421738_10172 [Algoriella xinjiangensis]VDH15922.1 Uncharacterised protein [Algoriella xinjiangensis]
MNSVEIYAKQRSNWGLLIGSLIFLFCSIYLFFNVNQVNSPTTAKLISVVMFVPSLILVLFSIKKLRKKQLIVLIDEKGIVFHPSEKLNYIVWGNIAEIEELKLPRQRVINIKVIESEKYIEAENQKILQARMKFWNQMYGAVVSFDANTLDKNHFEIMYIFDEFMTNYKSSLQN